MEKKNEKILKLFNETFGDQFEVVDVNGDMVKRAKIIDIAKKYNKPEEEFLRRFGGRIEWICKHGIGHTVWFPEGDNDVHGCDGCCEKLLLRKEQPKPRTEVLPGVGCSLKK